MSVLKLTGDPSGSMGLKGAITNKTSQKSCSAVDILSSTHSTYSILSGQK